MGLQNVRHLDATSILPEACTIEVTARPLDTPDLRQNLLGVVHMFQYLQADDQINILVGQWNRLTKGLKQLEVAAVSLDPSASQ